MKVAVNLSRRVFDADVEPIAVILTERDKALIRDMHPGAAVYSSFPDGYDTALVESWITDLRSSAMLAGRQWTDDDLKLAAQNVARGVSGFNTERDVFLLLRSVRDLRP